MREIGLFVSLKQETASRRRIQGILDSAGPMPVGELYRLYQRQFGARMTNVTIVLRDDKKNAAFFGMTIPMNIIMSRFERAIFNGMVASSNSMCVEWESIRPALEQETGRKFELKVNMMQGAEIAELAHAVEAVAAA